jgi:hypothetical protein
LAETFKAHKKSGACGSVARRASRRLKLKSPTKGITHSIYNIQYKRKDAK